MSVFLSHTAIPSHAQMTKKPLIFSYRAWFAMQLAELVSAFLKRAKTDTGFVSIHLLRTWADQKELVQKLTFRRCSPIRIFAIF